MEFVSSVSHLIFEKSFIFIDFTILYQMRNVEKMTVIVNFQRFGSISS